MKQPCQVKMTTHPEFPCSNKARFAVVCTRPDEETGVYYACTAHLGKAAKMVSKYKHPVQTNVQLIDLEDR